MAARNKPAPTKRQQRSDAQPPRDSSTFFVVGVGASAGGIEAITDLLKALPAEPGLALVFILHQDPRFSSNLTQILERATKIPLTTVREGMQVRPDHVYVAPADAEVAIDRGTLRLHERPTGVPSVIDGFFRSLAEDQATHAISVVLSGSGSDGTLGTRAVKGEGGITFAQDESAKSEGMPRSAIASGCVDFVLSPAEIADELVRMANHDSMLVDGATSLPSEDLTKVLGLVRVRHDIDFSNYKLSTIERRIRRRMALRRANSITEYVDMLRQDPAELEQLYGDLLIRVTGFFRDPEVFDALRNEVFPALIHERREDEPLRVWVPGCATGEEAYSIAIALLEAARGSGLSSSIQIFGTDVNQEVVERARAGIYPESIATEVSRERLRGFFNRIDGGYRVSKEVRDCCIFARQNLTRDPPFSRLDLISCRNVMIYFGSVLQKKVLSIFHYALRPDGYLLLGTSETIGNFGDLFSMADRKHKIYRKAMGSAGSQTDFLMSLPEAAPPVRAGEIEPAPVNALLREADRVLLDRISPAGVLINENMEILQFRGRTAPFLEIPPGAASFNLLKMAREGLLSDLRRAVFTARKKQAPDRREGIRIQTNDHTITITIEAIPFISHTHEPFMLVLFEENAREKVPRRTGKRQKAEPVPRQIQRLKRELEATREYLQAIIEEQETMNEELRSANEEIQSSNEELQSTNEELETAKEELQSSNEELTTLNEELENRNQELARVNSDLINVLSSVEIPILMLDSQYRIRRFNPSAQQILNVLPADIGRPISDLKMSLSVDDIRKVVDEVIEKLEVREMSVEDDSGRKFSLRVRPYRTTDNKIDGAVLALINLEEFGKQ